MPHQLKPNTQNLHGRELGAAIAQVLSPLFPLEEIARGFHAVVYRTAKNTALRVSNINSVSSIDLGFNYLQFCAASSRGEKSTTTWRPKVYQYHSCPECGLEFVEMELLTPLLTYVLSCEEGNKGLESNPYTVVEEWKTWLEHRELGARVSQHMALVDILKHLPCIFGTGNSGAQSNLAIASLSLVYTGLELRQLGKRRGRTLPHKKFRRYSPLAESDGLALGVLKELAEYAEKICSDYLASDVYMDITLDNICVRVVNTEPQLVVVDPFLSLRP